MLIFNFKLTILLTKFSVLKIYLIQHFNRKYLNTFVFHCKRIKMLITINPIRRIMNLELEKADVCLSVVIV